MNYDYLVTGEVTAIRENGATSGVGVLGSYTYDNFGRRTQLTRGNGTTTTWDYDPVSRLEELVQNPSGTTHDLTFGFAFNPASQIVSNTRSNDSYAFTGLANQNVADTHNGLNQITTAGGTSVSHDARGNITAIGTSAYGYSSENLLTSAPGPTTLAYDPLMRLYETVGGGPTARFAYDGATIIAEYNATNGIRRRFVHGPGVDEPLVSYEGSGTSIRRWYHADERGSIVAISDGTGAVTTINRYDEYGQPQAAPPERFGYTGQPWIPGANLWYYRARMYNPSLGRFMQTDPIGYAGGMNLYAYVFNDPINLVDPSGLRCAADEVVVILPHIEVRTPIPDDGEEETVTAPPFECVRLVSRFGWGVEIPFQWGHHYQFDVRITAPDTQCTESQAESALENHAVPGIEGPKVSGQNYPVIQWVPTPMGWAPIVVGSVQTDIRNEGSSVINTTLGNHFLRFGTVQLNMYGSQASGFSVRIIGSGLNASRFRAGANQLVGPGVFRHQMSKVRRQLRRTCGG